MASTKHKRRTSKKVEPSKSPDEPVKKPQTDKVFDVAKPGKSMPSVGTRPVIVTHRTLMRDPMVASTAPEEAPVADMPPKEEAGLPMNPGDKTRIEPLKPEEPVPEQPASGKEPTAEPPAEKAPEAPTAPSDDSAEDMAEASEDEAKAKKSADEESAADLERQTKAESLVASKQYFVPINSVKKRRSMRALVVGLVLIIIIAGVVLAMDAGVIDFGIKPPTNFIHN